jgi:hypothetical protein
MFEPPCTPVHQVISSCTLVDLDLQWVKRGHWTGFFEPQVDLASGTVH